MENIDFVSWMLGWPLVIAVDHYLSTKNRLLAGKKEKETTTGSSFVFVGIWVLGAILTYG